MKQYLLPQNGNFYKANLHCHTNLSDGVLSQEQVKEIYQEHGYSVVAFTDHELLFPVDHLADEAFLPLNGVELSVNEKERMDTTGKKVHLCCIAMEPDNHYTPCYHSKKYCWGNLEENRRLAKPVPGLPDFEREYSAEGINAIIAEAKRLGFFVTYNHPKWSLETPDDYCKYQGLDAMEICNFACHTLGYEEYNPEIYDALLRKGNRLYCIAADDNHNHKPADSSLYDSFGAFTMIKAEKLEYRTITQALKNGHFYATQGPEIHELYVEDGSLHVSCSPAEKIILTTSHRRRRIIWANRGEAVTEGMFSICQEDVYVRITVIDHTGRPANTNAYFTDCLGL